MRKVESDWRAWAFSKREMSPRVTVTLDGRASFQNGHYARNFFSGSQYLGFHPLLRLS